ncbi:unnamed protein product [Linum tenue]|uniref:TF-B3 domain-containing protein n=1 Tax=Linum tenue TaxID=586396 RepID=A0AAV0LB21_9ROSI|nr:unnamed protein product [Linum tenue]
MVPKKYSMDHFDCVSNPVTLELPNGDAWLVELVRDDLGKRVWFGKGWQQFSQHYHFQHGHFLLFELLGNSHFSVNIFDRTAAEMKYSQFTVGVPNGETAKIIAKEDGAATNSVLPRRRPSFTKVIVKNSRKSGVNNLNVPSRFVETYLATGSGEKGDIMVKLNVGGESWAVKVVRYERKTGCWMSKGWWKFAMDNSLKAWDRCTFELRDAGNEFDVQIQRC